MINFTCPWCSSDSWGTCDPTLPEDRWVRYCRADMCSFEWKSADDHLYLRDYEGEIKSFKMMIKQLKNHVAVLSAQVEAKRAAR